MASNSPQLIPRGLDVKLRRIWLASRAYEDGVLLMWRKQYEKATHCFREAWLNADALDLKWKSLRNLQRCRSRARGVIDLRSLGLGIWFGGRPIRSREAKRVILTGAKRLRRKKS